jgi:hypothetical protein
MATLKDKQKYIDKARATEDKYNIPPYTLVGLLETESNFDPNVISGKKKSSAGAEGIAQFMPLTSKAFKIDPYNTDQAIDAAGKYLSQSYKSLGNWNDSILSYNMGVQGVKNYKGGKKKLVKEQREYVGKVLNNQAKYVKTKQQPSIESYKQENKIREAVKDNIPTNNVKYLDIPKNKVTFASVPEMAQKPQEEVVDQDIAQVEQQTNESLFLDQVAAMQYEPQEEEQPSLMTTDVTGMYNYASNFVESPLVAQQGGEEIIDDNQGQYNHPGKVTRIKSPFITMKDVPYDILAVANNGEKRILKPEEGHYFKGATEVTEYPILTEAEKQFLKEIYGQR